MEARLSCQLRREGTFSDFGVVKVHSHCVIPEEQEHLAEGGDDSSGMGNN